jgi:hypothetical protein
MNSFSSSPRFASQKIWQFYLDLEEVGFWVKKKSGSISRVLSCAVIYLGRLSPAGSYTPEAYKAAYPLLIPGPGVSIFGLAGGGACPAGAVTVAAVRSCRTFSPLPRLHCKRPQAVYFLWRYPALARFAPYEVAAVNCRRALSCSDFPPARETRASDRPTHSFQYYITNWNNLFLISKSFRAVLYSNKLAYRYV